MSANYLAKIINGVVDQVILGTSVEWAENRLGGQWVLASSSCGIGFTYSEENGFRPPQPHSDYVWVDDKWQAPIKVLQLSSNSEAYAQALISAVGGIYLGEHELSPEVFQYQFHPISGNLALVFKDQEAFVHSEESLETLLSLMSPAMGGQEAIDAYYAKVAAYNGQIKRLSDYIPDVFLPNLMSEAEAISSGWL